MLIEAQTTRYPYPQEVPVPRPLLCLPTRKVLRWCCLGLWSLLFLLWVPEKAIGEDTRRSLSIPKELTVRFEGALASASYAEVIVTLGSQGLLNLTTYVDRDGLTPAEILSKTNRLVGTMVPPILNQYLCGLNPHVCSRPGEDKSSHVAWKNTKAPAGVFPDAQPGAAECPNPKLPRYMLCLPDLTVDHYKTSRSLPYNAEQENLKEIVVERTEGCLKWNAKCKKIIRSLNPHLLNDVDALSRQYAGKLRLPVQAYGITFPIVSAQQLEQITQAIDSLTLEGTRLRQEEKLNVYYTVPPASTRAQSHIVKMPLVNAEPLQEYLGPLQVMDYPYSSADKFYSARPIPVNVGVWDNRVDQEHCDLQQIDGVSAVVLFEPLPLDGNDPPAPAREHNCDQKRDMFEDKYDHATHVAAVLAARFNEHGIAGVNPRAKLWAYEINGARLEKEGDPIYNAIEKISHVPIINISQTLEQAQYQSQLRKLVAGEKAYNTILFVAAAGAEEQERGGKKLGKLIQSMSECSVIPACWSSDPQHGHHIISVVALDSKGEGLLLNADSTPASHHGLMFDVAAVGEAMSAFHGNKFGPMAGSSVAAPYVAGLASLLYAMAPKTLLTPQAIKWRILYTADFHETFEELVRFGRVNFRRALNYAQDIVYKKKRQCDNDCEIKGKILKEGTIGITEGILDGQSDIPPNLAVKDIRRIVATDDTADSPYWIVYMSEGQLKKMSRVKFERDAVLKYKLQNGRPAKEVLLRTVQDYTACAFECSK